MGDNEPDVYTIAIPPEWREELDGALREAATAAGVSGEYTLAEVDPGEVPNALRFDPVSVSLYVGAIVVNAVAGHFIGKGLEALVARIRSRGKTGVAGEGVRVLVLLPNGDVAQMHTDDAEATLAALEKVKRIADG